MIRSHLSDFSFWFCIKIPFKFLTTTNFLLQVSNKNTYDSNPYNDNAKSTRNSRNAYHNLSREQSEERLRYYQGVLTQFKTRKLRSQSTTSTHVSESKQAKGVYSQKIRYPKVGKVGKMEKRESPVKVEINCNLYKPW